MKVFLVDKGGSALPDALYDGVRVVAGSATQLVLDVERPIFVMSAPELDDASLLEAARVTAAGGDGIVIELPVSRAALAACSTLFEEGVPTNVVGVQSVAAALLAAKARATFVTVVIRDEAAADLLVDVCSAFDAHDIETEVLADVSRADDLDEAGLAGVHGVFTPTALIAEALT